MTPIIVTSLGGLALRSKKRTFSWPETREVIANRNKKPKKNLNEGFFMMSLFLLDGSGAEEQERTEKTEKGAYLCSLRCLLFLLLLMEHRLFSFFQLVVLSLQRRFLLE